jgi:hypothetical protein
MANWTRFVTFACLRDTGLSRPGPRHFGYDSRFNIFTIISTRTRHLPRYFAFKEDAIRIYDRCHLHAHFDRLSRYQALNARIIVPAFTRHFDRVSADGARKPNICNAYHAWLYRDHSGGPLIAWTLARSRTSTRRSGVVDGAMKFSRYQCRR